MPNWAGLCAACPGTEQAASVLDANDMTVKGVAGVTGTLPHVVGLPGRRTRWLKVESAVDADDTVEASLKAGDVVSLRNWSRWTCSIRSRIWPSPELFDRTSCFSAPSLEAAGKEGFDGLLTVDVDAGTDAVVNVGEAIGEVGNW